MLKHSVVKQLPMIAILILASFLMLWRLGEPHLTNWDEAWYAAVARSMVETGNLMTPMWNGQPFYEKPPLFYWLTAFSFKLFGSSEFSARFISALSGIGTLGLVYWFSKRRWGERTAILSSLILLSTPAFLWRARTGNLDSLLTFFIFFSAIAVLHADKKNRWNWIMGIVAGMAFLTKGVIGFLFPLLAVSFLFWKKDMTSLRHVSKGLGLGIVIVAIWFGISYFINGKLFTSQFFAQQSEKIGSLQTVIARFSFDYLTHLKTGLKLWLVIFVPSFFYTLAKWQKKKEMILPGFIFVFLFLLSFLQEKSTWFLHPIYPLVASMCGWSLTEWGKRIRYGSLLIPIGVVLIALFQLVHFRGEYLVPDIAVDEARIALATKQFTNVDDVVYLTHYYFPTAVYYSGRKTFAVYSEHPSVSWWILPKSEWKEIFKQDRVFVNTSVEDFRELQRRFPQVQFDTLFQSGDKLLVKKST